MASCYTAGLQCHTGHYGFGSTIASRWLAPPCSLKWICGSARVARWQSVSSLGWPVYLWRALLSRQCIKCLVKPVCAPLLLKLLLVCQPAAEKSAVITYKVLKWKILQTLFLLFILYFKKKIFSMVLLFSSVQLFALFHPPVNQSAFARHTGHTVMFSWDFRGLHGSIYLSAYCPNWIVYADRHFCRTMNYTEAALYGRKNKMWLLLSRLSEEFMVFSQTQTTEMMLYRDSSNTRVSLVGIRGKDRQEVESSGTSIGQGPRKGKKPVGPGTDPSRGRGNPMQ